MSSGAGRARESLQSAQEAHTAAVGLQQQVEQVEKKEEPARYSQRAPEVGGSTWSGMATHEHAKQAIAAAGEGSSTAPEAEKGQSTSDIEAITEKMKEWTGGLGQRDAEQSGGGGVGEKVQEVWAGAKEKVEQAWTKAKEATTGHSAISE